MIGEESGGELGASGFSVAVDPIDGTWAFLTQTESYAVTVNVFWEGAPFIGVVANPATGEVAYVGPEGPPRLIRIGLLGQADQATNLPLNSTPNDQTLVHLHPSSGGQSMANGLHRAWEGGDVRMVRSPGGSPAWGLVEAAKGHFTYVNRWSGRPVEPWDLVGGVEIVRRAGGEVVNLRGEPIDTLKHSGLFIAGLFPTGRDRVARIISMSLRDST
jgi:myo-inositol-1(or 4)-monophosphatase